jgi:hypothetical protein
VAKDLFTVFLYYFTRGPKSHFTLENLNLSIIFWLNGVIFSLLIKEHSVFILIRKTLTNTALECKVFQESLYILQVYFSIHVYVTGLIIISSLHHFYRRTTCCPFTSTHFIHLRIAPFNTFEGMFVMYSGRHPWSWSRDFSACWLWSYKHYSDDTSRKYFPTFFLWVWTMSTLLLPRSAIMWWGKTYFSSLKWLLRHLVNREIDILIYDDIAFYVHWMWSIFCG